MEAHGQTSALPRLLLAGRSRRSLLSQLGRGSIATGLALLVGSERTAASNKKKRRRKRKKNRCQGGVNGSATPAEEDALLRMINDFRATNGLMQPLNPQPQLKSAAISHSQDMARRCFFEHVNPDGVDPFQRMKAAGYPGVPISENIYKGSGNLGSAAAAFNAWRDSPGHRANMLDNRVSEIGIGTALDASGFMVWTNVFGRPRT